jgi:hydrogenase-4 component F
MGIVAIGLSFGVPLAAFGVLLHVLAHAAAKGGAFMGAGVMMRAFHTKDLLRIRDGIRVLPYSAPLFLLLVLGLAGLPPAGIFRSEFQIVAGGFQAHSVPAGILIVLVTVAFVGLVSVVTRMVAGPGETAVPVGEPSRAMILGMLLCLLALVVLGVHPPGFLDRVLHSAAAQLVTS